MLQFLMRKWGRVVDLRTSVYRKRHCYAVTSINFMGETQGETYVAIRRVREKVYLE